MVIKAGVDLDIVKTITFMFFFRLYKRAFSFSCSSDSVKRSPYKGLEQWKPPTENLLTLNGACLGNLGSLKTSNLLSIHT